MQSRMYSIIPSTNWRDRLTAWAQFEKNMSKALMTKGRDWDTLLVLVRTCPARKIIRYPLNSSNAQILCQKVRRVRNLSFLMMAMGTKYYLKKETRKGLWGKPFR